MGIAISWIINLRAEELDDLMLYIAKIKNSGGKCMITLIGKKK